MTAVQVRWAEQSDAHAVAGVHIDSWRVAYRGLIADEVLDGLDLTQRTQRWSALIGSSEHGLRVAELDGRIVGWASFGRGRDEGLEDRGELSGLYAAPDAWGHGVGHALITRVEDDLRADGFSSAYLWVLDGNERAIGFYERHGWHGDGTVKIGAAGGASDLRELRHVRTL
ncbi:GNAT family N-acetyltransferase [Microbacterium gorillae]|uniref:GNAT family N-acetyltransferase n=1 Tax=Microbacterium gorillae TaxID=1231063 RepID=UPI00058B2A82|nr:GNAT family N-acetyltransferase [Microbacterium gorillae]